MKYRYNWIPDRPDARDFIYSSRLFKLGLTKLPDKVDLSPECSEVENQLEIGSCTANALVGNLEFLEKGSPKKQTDLSRLFVYYNERALEGTTGEDGGARLRDGIKILHKLGVCDESDWPYLTSRVLDRPSASCFEDALNRRITTYERLKTLAEMKDCLASGFPFVFGFKVYSSFESLAVAQNENLIFPHVTRHLWGVTP